MKIQIKRPVALHEAGGKSLNEDFIWPTKDKASDEEELFIVCDGEGGPNAGENASKLIGLSFAKFYASTPPVENTQKEYLEAALMKAEAALSAYKEGNEDKKQMQATLSLLHFGKSEATLAWIGDSQAFYYSHAKGELMGSNQSGPSTEEGQVITGTHEAAKISCISVPYADISEKDYFFLGSKGIAEQVGSTTLSAMFSAKNKPDPDFIISEINSLSEGFTKDNYSCYLIQVDKVEGSSLANEISTEGNVESAAKEAATIPMTASDVANQEENPNRLFRNVALGAAVFALLWIFGVLWLNSRQNKFEDYMKTANLQVENKNYHNALDQIDSALSHVNRQLASGEMSQNEADALITRANKRSAEIQALQVQYAGLDVDIDPASLTNTPQEYIDWGNESMRLGSYELALENYKKARIKRGSETSPEIPGDSIIIAYLKLGNQLFEAEDQDCEKILTYFNKAFSDSTSKILSDSNSLYYQSRLRANSCNLALNRAVDSKAPIAQNTRGLDLGNNSSAKEQAPSNSSTNKRKTQTTPKSTTTTSSSSKNFRSQDNKSGSNTSNKRITNSGINSLRLDPGTESGLRKALSDGKRLFTQAKEKNSDYLYKQSAIQLEEATAVLDGSGAYLLAYLHHMGKGVDKDDAKALKFAQKSALKNWPAGHYLYAHLLLERDNPRDTLTAKQSLNRAAQLNYADAFKRLAQLE
ncbi:MAG: protein phosphatase 2C domain-containing protein [Bacteroidota bacterium]